MTSFKDIYKREPIRDRNFVMPFGKYAGSPLREIIENDPQYILWLQAGEGIEFHSDIIDEAEGIDPHYWTSKVSLSRRGDGTT